MNTEIANVDEKKVLPSQVFESAETFQASRRERMHPKDWQAARRSRQGFQTMPTA